MKDKTSDQPTISRRGLIALLGGLAMAPLASATSSDQEGDKEYVTVLQADGTPVRIPKQLEKNARVINARMSNKGLLNWIKRKKS